jgi:hypothetical protein
VAGGFDGSLAAAPSTRDRAREFGTIDAVLDEGSVDVNRDDFAECQPRLGVPALGILQSNDFGKPALKGNRAFGHSWHVDESAGGCGKPRDRELTGVTSDIGSRRVHLPGESRGRKIPAERLGLLNICCTILPVGRGETDDRWLVAKGVEEAVRREVDIASSAAR